MLLSLLLSIVTLCVSRSEVYVVDRRYNDTTECLQPSTTPCHSLEYLADNAMMNNAVIKITSSRIEMIAVAKFTDIGNLTIKGELGTATIQCHANRSSNETGIIFENAARIQLMNVKLVGCGANFTDAHDGEVTVYSMLVYLSQDVLINDITITQTTNGYGLLMINNTKNMVITNSEFINNTCAATKCRGMLIQNYDLHSPSLYMLQSVNFTRNGGNKTLLSKKRYRSVSGGLKILFISSSYSNVKIDDAIFNANVAKYGGGIYVLNYGSSQDNDVEISNSVFIDNVASDSGGGADVGFLQNKLEDDPKSNSVVFRKCEFKENKAGSKGAGGLSVITSFGHLKNITCNSTLNEVMIFDCLFQENESKQTSALKAVLEQSGSEGITVYTEVVINNCIFSNNKAKAKDEHYSTGATVMTIQVSLVFHGNNVFNKNKGTALLIDGAIAIFDYSNNTFIDNVAERGAGMYLINHSFMELKHHNTFKFIKNKARYGTGMLVTQISPMHLQELDHCFLKGDSKQSSYVFQHNKAVTGVGKDMFIYNLVACLKEEKGHINISSIFERNIIGSFTFDEAEPCINQSITTAPCELSVDQTMIHPVPGKKFDLTIKQLDQFKQKMNDYFVIFLYFDETDGDINKQIDLSPTADVSSNAKLTFNGKPGTTNVLNIKSGLLTTNTLKITVKMGECLPGYIYIPDSKSCDCSQLYDKTSTGIAYCYKKEYALLEVGYWIGHIYHDTSDTSLFYTGRCLPYICLFTDSNVLFGWYLKLDTTNITQLEEYVCAENRRGVLCSQCINDSFSVYYNSVKFTCNKNKHCSIGFLYFILIEIIPTTILFLFIMLFNVNLTTGSVYTLVFYIQILYAFSIDSAGLLKLSKTIQVIRMIYQAFYGIANMRFFEIEEFSFCIWKGAKTLDIITMKYTVAVYAIILILVTLALLKLYPLYTCITKLCQKCGKRNIRYSVVHSLSAFILICYFHMMITSMSIVACQELTTFGSREPKQSWVAVFDGNKTCYSRQHLVYMIPAIICLALLSIPPAVLIAEPLLMYATSKLKIEIKSRIISKARIVLKPFLDSFQGCFKNDCRVFAGFFFSYRIALASVLVVSSNINFQYNIALSLLIVIITIHGTVQPFAVAWHNKLDLFLLVNMTAFILLSQVNLSIQQTTSLASVTNFLIPVIQLTLCAAPFVFIAIYFASICWRKRGRRKKNDMKSASSRVSDGVLFSRMTTKYIDFGLPLFDRLSDSDT